MVAQLIPTNHIFAISSSPCQNSSSLVPILSHICPVKTLLYRSAYKSLARPGRKQANVSVRMGWISFGALLCRGEKKLDDNSRLDVVEIAPSLTCSRVCFLSGRAKDLSAYRYYFLKVKVKFTIQQPTKAQRGVQVWLYSFFKLGARWGRCWTPRPVLFTPTKDKVPIV